jgi:ADP-ribose pyrophosphatase
VCAGWSCSTAGSPTRASASTSSSAVTAARTGPRSRARSILAHDDEFVYLVAQPREAVEEDALLEIPAGTRDHEGETELECARRELAEEAFLAATDWTELAKIYPSPGYISEVVTIFIATGLSPASGERDEDEAIEIVPLPLAELDEALPRIRDASTLIALMALRDRLA